MADSQIARRSKICSTCSQRLDLDQFTFDKRKPDGHSSECRDCNRARSRRYYEANKAKVLERTSRYHGNNPEWRLEYYKKYYQDRVDAYRERGLKWQRDNRDRVRELSRLWRKNNPEKVKNIARAHNAKRYAAYSSGVTAKSLRIWLDEQDLVCFYCGRDCTDGSFEIDHFYPLARGGKHELENLRIACMPCNRRKNARDPQEFIKSLPEKRLRRPCAP